MRLSHPVIRDLVNEYGEKYKVDPFAPFGHSCESSFQPKQVNYGSRLDADHAETGKWIAEKLKVEFDEESLTTPVQHRIRHLPSILSVGPLLREEVALAAYNGVIGNDEVVEGRVCPKTENPDDIPLDETRYYVKSGR